jgi:hypothetical protein
MSGICQVQTNAVFYLMGNESFLHTFNLSIICVRPKIKIGLFAVGRRPIL